MQLKTCCRCCSLRTGTIVSGVFGILLVVVALIAMFTTDVKMKTIVDGSLDPYIVKIILAINLFMTIVLSTLMIIGAIRRNTLLMLPWVVLGIMVIVAFLISIIYTSVMFFIDHKNLSGSIYLVFGLIAVVIYLYMWLVVYSYFQQIRLEKVNGRMGPYGRPYNYRRP